MYKLPYYIETDETVIHEFLIQNPFAIVSGILNNKPVATHVPLDVEKVDGKYIFTGHVMKGTDHYKGFLQNENVLVVFSGPHCYVSASWYENKQKGSTWNYMDAQAHGKLKFTDDAGTWKIVEDITKKYEGLDSEASFSKITKEYMERNIKAISGFHIEVERLDVVFKLSQNESHQTQKQIVENLKKINHNNSREIAMQMEKRLS
ncbi:MAG: FMN-binding negative transcriptional regulator [Ginsengibacter sp.]